MEVKIVDLKSQTAARDFASSLHETGFAVIDNHDIDASLVHSIYDEWLGFFNSDAKYKYKFDVQKQDGYFPPEVSEIAKGHTEKDLKEYYHIYSWGRFPKELSSDAFILKEHSTKLALQLLKMLGSQLPDNISAQLYEPLDSMIQGSEDRALLRVLHYPPMTGDEKPGAIRAAAHGDIDLLTVLPSSNEPGLQVKPLGSDQWLDVPCKQDTIIINAGDMLDEATSGYFPSTLHRVINPTGECIARSRLTVPLFLHPRQGVRLSERYTYEEYLNERLKELGVI